MHETYAGAPSSRASEARALMTPLAAPHPLRVAMDALLLVALAGLLFFGFLALLYTIKARLGLDAIPDVDMLPDRSIQAFLPWFR